MSVPVATKSAWNNTLFDCAGAPGGLGTCAYVWCCPCLAAGSVAAATGRSFALSCIITWTPLWPCWLALDRAAVIDKFGIRDAGGFLTSCLLFSCGCGPCLLCQELNHIKAQDVSTESYAAVGPDQQLMNQTPGTMDTPARRDWTRAHQLR